MKSNVAISHFYRVKPKGVIMKRNCCSKVLFKIEVLQAIMNLFCYKKATLFLQKKNTFHAISYKKCYNYLFLSIHFPFSSITFVFVSLQRSKVSDSSQWCLVYIRNSKRNNFIMCGLCMRQLLRQKKMKTKVNEVSDFTGKCQRFCFLVYVFKRNYPKTIPNLFDSAETWSISFNHSVCNCMKSLFIVCLKLATATSNQCPGAILISLFFSDEVFQS